MALKQSVAEVGAIGCNLQLTKLAHQGMAGPTRGIACGGYFRGGARATRAAARDGVRRLAAAPGSGDPHYTRIPKWNTLMSRKSNQFPGYILNNNKLNAPHEAALQGQAQINGRARKN